MNRKYQYGYIGDMKSEVEKVVKVLDASLPDLPAGFCDALCGLIVAASKGPASDALSQRSQVSESHPDPLEK